MKPWGLIFFDVDSTLVGIEGIDELAGDSADVAALTRAAMDGEIPIEDVYGRRLDLIQPTRDALRELGGLYVRSLVPGAEEVIAGLRQTGADVHLLTAGITQAIEPLAAHLGIRQGAVHSVGVRFDADGNYLDFERDNPLTRTGGKALIIQDLRVRAKGRVAMIGDGMSDLETRDVVDLFIGFGGVAERERVRREAHRYIAERSLLPVLQILRET